LQFDDSEVNSKNVSLSIKKFLPDTRLISESQIPFFLSVYWFLRRIDATEHPVRYLKMIIDSIIASSKDGQGLPNPYYKEQDLIPIIIQNELQKEINPSMSLGADPIDDHFKYDSFYLEGLVHLYVRYNYKQEMKFTWSKITRFRFKFFQLEEQWHFFKWRNEDQGQEKSYLPAHTKSWGELRTEAETLDTENIPNFITKDPIFGLLFLQIFPHRVTSDLIKFLNSELT
jgi:hypothetical protein